MGNFKLFFHISYVEILPKNSFGEHISLLENMIALHDSDSSKFPLFLDKMFMSLLIIGFFFCDIGFTSFP
jgi:hypothetical protein